MERAVFLDKDGTLVYNVPYNVNPALVTYYEDVFDGLRRLQSKGFKLVIVTNQPGVALGYFGENSVMNLERAMTETLQQEGIYLNGFYYCPHYENGKVDNYRVACTCRKPKPGMLQKAAKDLSLDLTKSYMIGDILHDVEAGNRAGCKSILIKNGNETEWFFNKHRLPLGIVKNFKEACDKIIKETDVLDKGGMYERRFEESY